jgi:4-hydroxy-tetrahydrodipicolinate reductase
VAEDSDLALVAAIDRSNIGERIGIVAGFRDTDGEDHVRVSDELQTLLQAQAEVAVDFTHPDVVMEDVRWAIGHAVHLVVGTTGISETDIEEIEGLLDPESPESNVIVAPNFAVGAVLAQRFAAQAARFFPAAEVIELHHDGKADSPSGTSLATARRLSAARLSEYRGPDRESVAGSRGAEVEGVRVHSVRLPGLVAHQEVLFGGPGEILTIRHDSIDRVSFMPGVLLAVKQIVRRPGLTVGLEPLLDLDGEAD